MIDFSDDPQRAATVVEFVDGPQAGDRRDVRDDDGPVIREQGSSYRRSVQCADDGALRYVWIPDDAEST
ncbi:MAG: hypothetical protein H0V73_10300 [Chloroflexi bacterium]|nr:hypothetical protein [Chloroflexota bacterium]